MAAYMEPYKTTILSLKDDNILEIFDYLSPNYQDQVFFGLTNQRFSNLFQFWAKSKKIKIIAKDLEKMEFRDFMDFFQLGGPFIMSIYIDCKLVEKKSLIVEFVGEYCTNLVQIDFNNVCPDFYYGRLLRRVKTLVKLTCKCNEINGVVIFDLKQNPGFTTFEMTGGCYMGTNICCYRNLRHLVLRRCSLWDTTEFYIKLRYLKSLEVTDCVFEFRKDPLFQTIHQHCIDLEDLTFSCYDVNYDMVPRIPKLKRLTLNTWRTSNKLENKFIEDLEVEKTEELEYLKFMGEIEVSMTHALAIGGIQALKELHWYNNNHLTNEHLAYFTELDNLEVFSINSCLFVTKIGLMNLLKKCTNLRLIDIQNTGNITDAFIIEAVRFHRKRKFYGETRPALVVKSQRTGITADVLEHPDYLLGEPMFKLAIQS